MTPAKKTMVKNMAIGAVAMGLVICVPKIGEKISDILASVRSKIGG